MSENKIRSRVYDKVLDIVVVIVGITIAFQVDQWKDNRDRAAREDRYLHSMLADIEKDISEYHDNMNDLSRDRDLIIRALTRLTKDEEISDSLGYIVIAVLHSKTFEGHSNTYSKIITSDGIDIITDNNTRELSIEHYRLYSSLSKYEVRYFELLEQFRIFFTPHIYFNRSGKLLNKSIAKDILTENLFTLAAIQQSEGIARYKGSLDKAIELKRSIEEQVKIR